MSFKVNNVNDLELVYSIVKDQYPDRAVEVTYDYETKEYILSYRKAGKVVADTTEVPVDLQIQVVYGDSVTGDTPIIVRNPDTKFVSVKRIDQLVRDMEDWHYYFGFRFFDRTINNDKQYANTMYETWTDSGWAPIRKIIRHKSTKKLYNVNTINGSVTVTEDHSLLTKEFSQIKPAELQIGQVLLTSFPAFNQQETEYHLSYPRYFTEIPDSILNDDILTIHRFLNHYKTVVPYKYHKETDLETFIVKNKVHAQKLYYMLKKCKYRFIEIADDVSKADGVSAYEITFGQTSPHLSSRTDKDFASRVSSVSCYGVPDQDDYVYDIETATGRFNAGVGEIVVKNTDSVFLRFAYNHTDFQKNRRDTFELATLCGEKLTREVFARPPIEMEFEKVFQPFVLLTKKRYIAKKYDNPKDPFQLKGIDAKGIALTRRDYCKMVKLCYKEIIDTIMDTTIKNNVRESINVFYRYIGEIGNYEVATENLVVSAMLAKTYKSDNIAHVNLSKRLKERKEEVQVGDRIPYIFIESDDPKAKKSELAEDPKYIAEHKLKFNRVCYLEQLAKPILGFYKIVLKNDEPLLDEVIDFVNDNLVSFGGKRLRVSDFKEE